MSEFNEVFEQLEAPEYPATCDECGAEGTNANLDEHICQPRNESPALRAGEGERENGTNRYLKSEIAHLLKENTTLIEQRDRLLRLLRPVTSPTSCYCAVMESEKCWHCEARELITTIEQEGKS